MRRERARRREIERLSGRGREAGRGSGTEEERGREEGSDSLEVCVSDLAKARREREEDRMWREWFDGWHYDSGKKSS
jgi:hypothetical protein